MSWKGYRVTSPFGWRKHPIHGNKSFHTGIDLVKSHKAPIEAFAGGTVLFAGFGKTGSGFGGYGNVVLIKDKDGRGQVYAHLDSVAVKKGQTVKKGQVIGYQGNTGQSTGSHLHFEVRKKAESSPPYGWIANRENNCLEPTNYIDNYNKVSNNKSSAKKGANLKVDGKWGNDTTRAMQRYFGTPADGILSGQSKNSVTNSLYGNTVRYGKGGSLVIKALQRYLNSKGFKLKVDGLLGPSTIRALQSYLGTVVDGKLSRPSLVIKEMQKRLNNETF